MKKVITFEALQMGQQNIEISNCGHKHRTWDAAAKCAIRESKGWNVFVKPIVEARQDGVRLYTSSAYNGEPDPEEERQCNECC